MTEVTTDAPRFELFSFWRTSATYRMRVAFNLKRVLPQERNVDIDAGEQRGEAFLKINPMGAIPALVDRGPSQARTPLTQSLAILEFLDESYLTFAPLSADAHGRARVRSLAAMPAAATQDPINGKAFEEKVTAAAWETKPSWYVVASEDHMIQPAQQDAMANTIGAKVTTLKSSHVPQQSQPEKVAAVILDAVNSAK